MLRVTRCRDARECQVGGRPSPLKETISILVLPFYNGRSTERPYTGLLVSLDAS